MGIFEHSRRTVTTTVTTEEIVEDLSPEVDDLDDEDFDDSTEAPAPAYAARFSSTEDQPLSVTVTDGGLGRGTFRYANRQALAQAIVDHGSLYGQDGTVTLVITAS